MSVFYNTDLYNVRKALRTLKESGIIESKPKSGFFVSGPLVREKTPQSPHNNYALKDVCFFTQSKVPLHKEMWNKITNQFQQENPYVKISVHYEKTEAVPDIVEYGDAIRNYQHNDIPMLDLKPFISNSRSTISNGSFMPFYYHSPCIFYNTSFLKKAGLPLPGYSDFKGQTEYHRLISVAEKKEHRCFQIANMQPLIFMGRQLQAIQEKIKSKTSDAGNLALENGIAELAESVRDLYTNIYENLHMANSLEESFASQKLPIFQGSTSQLGVLEFAKLPFEWGIYPIFAIDNTTFKFPLNGVISRKTHDPIGSVRFMQFLQEDKAQQYFAEAGCIPLLKNFLGDSMIAMRAGSASTVFISALDKADLFFYNSYTDFYISYRIVNTILFDCILKGKRKEDALSEIIRLGKVYLNMKGTEQ